MLPEPFSRHRFCDLLSRISHVHHAGLPLFLKISLVTMLPSFLFTLFVSFESKHLMEAVVDMIQNGGDFRRLLANIDLFAEVRSLVRNVFLGFVLYTIMLFLLQSAAILGSAAIYIQRTPSFVNLLKDSVPRLPSLFLLGFIFIVGYLVFSLAAIIVDSIIVVIAAILFGSTASRVMWVLAMLATVAALIYIALSASFAVPVIVVERASAFDALQRSLELTKGHRLTVWGIMTVITTAMAVAQMFLARVLSLVIGVNPVVQSLVLSMFSSILTPVVWISTTVMYINARVVNEGCNVQVLTRDLSPEDADAEFRYATVSYKNVPQSEKIPVAEVI